MEPATVDLEKGRAPMLHRGRFPLTWKLRCLVIAGAMVIAAIVGPLVITQPASAAVSYGVSMNSACQQQYPGQGAMSGYWSITNAYSWFCWRIGGGSLSFGTGGINVTINATVLGGINVGAWCSRNHPGTFAVTTNRYWAYSWLCWSY